jgi:trans-2-enoyl-CoA reductase
VSLPATAGVEGIGVVIATAKNVPTLKDAALEVKDWVIARPEARLKPVGCFATLCVCDSSQLMKVPAQLMPVQHLACSRSLCTAYRLLEDYGGVRPGDTIIQNAADLPVGQAVIQLCKMLKVRSINLVGDDDGFERTKDLLTELGATYVLRDNSKLAEFIGAIGHMMPRLAIDALGGEGGRRMMVALRPGGSLVMHSLQTGQVPSMSPSLLMYQQVSLHGFNLSQWVDENGNEAYLHMLRTVAGLVQADKLSIFTRSLGVADLNAATLVDALKSHRAVQDASTFRERTVLVFGDESAANEVYFELQASIRSLAPAPPEAREVQRVEKSPLAAAAPAAPAAGGLPRASQRWADAKAMLKDLKLERYASQFEEEEMTSMELLEEIVGRGDGEKELMDALKEMGIKKMGHRQTIVGAIVGKL